MLLWETNWFETICEYTKRCLSGWCVASSPLNICKCLAFECKCRCAFISNILSFHAKQFGGNKSAALRRFSFVLIFRVAKMTAVVCSLLSHRMIAPNCSQYELNALHIRICKTAPSFYNPFLSQHFSNGSFECNKWFNMRLAVHIDGLHRLSAVTVMITYFQSLLQYKNNNRRLCARIERNRWFPLFSPCEVRA